MPPILQIILGTIPVIVTLVAIAIRFGTTIGAVNTVVSAHTAMFITHTSRMDRYEQTQLQIVGDLSRMMGRIEATQDRIDRTTGHRKGEIAHG